MDKKTLYDLPKDMLVKLICEIKTKKQYIVYYFGMSGEERLHLYDNYDDAKEKFTELVNEFKDPFAGNTLPVYKITEKEDLFCFCDYEEWEQIGIRELTLENYIK